MNNDWIPWSGGPCPFAVPTRLNIRCAWEMRDDGVYPLDDAIYVSNEPQLDWAHKGRIAGRVIAYRLAEED